LTLRRTTLIRESGSSYGSKTLFNRTSPHSKRAGTGSGTAISIHRHCYTANGVKNAVNLHDASIAIDRCAVQSRIEAQGC